MWRWHALPLEYCDYQQIIFRKLMLALKQKVLFQDLLHHVGKFHWPVRLSDLLTIQDLWNSWNVRISNWERCICKISEQMLYWISYGFRSVCIHIIKRQFNYMLYFYELHSLRSRISWEVGINHSCHFSFECNFTRCALKGTDVCSLHWLVTDTRQIF